MDSSVDDLLRGLAGRIDALEAARSELTSKVDALQSDNVSLRRETHGLEQETGRLNQKVDGLTRDNTILREEIASLKYGESTAVDPRRRSQTEALSLTALGNDATVHIASFLGATDIASLGRTCRHFGKRSLMPDGQMTSLVDELAGRVVDGSATDYEKSVLVGGKKIKLLRELELMRLPLYFKQLIGDGDMIKYSQPLQDMSTISVSCSDDEYVTAISNHVMKTGKHYVTFCIRSVDDLSHLDFGVIRPIKDWGKKGLYSFDPMCYDLNQIQYRHPLLAEKTEDWGNDLHCCSYQSYEGRCFYANWCDEDKDAGDRWDGDEWEGMEHLNTNGNVTVGLLLDLNSGTLSVFKDGRMLGVIKEALTGAYCWFFCGHVTTCEVKIERGTSPATRND